MGPSRLRGLCAQVARNSKIKVVGAVLTPWCPRAEGCASHTPHFVPFQGAPWKVLLMQQVVPCSSAVFGVPSPKRTCVRAVMRGAG